MRRGNEYSEEYLKQLDLLFKYKGRFNTDAWCIAYGDELHKIYNRDISMKMWSKNEIQDFVDYSQTFKYFNVDYVYDKNTPVDINLYTIFVNSLLGCVYDDLIGPMGEHRVGKVRCHLGDYINMPDHCISINSIEEYEEQYGKGFFRKIWGLVKIDAIDYDININVILERGWYKSPYESHSRLLTGMRIGEVTYESVIASAHSFDTFALSGLGGLDV